MLDINFRVQTSFSYQLKTWWTADNCIVVTLANTECNNTTKNNEHELILS